MLAGTFMSGFTDEIRAFLRSQGISEGEVCDASMTSSRGYKRKMEGEGKPFAIVKDACYRGHYIRSQKGHCMQCDTSRIAYVRRYGKEAYVYIVGSRRERLLKIGFSEMPWDRASHLNSIGYGGIQDWEILYYANYARAGEVETTAHSKLTWYASPRTWVREGTVQTSREVFRCSYTTALDAVKAASDVPGEGIWECHWAKRRAFQEEEGAQ
jgi:hypothetical protein